MQLTKGFLLQGGKYKIESILGQGGFGITYKATMRIEVQGPLGMIQTEISVAVKEFFMKELCNRDEQTCQVSVPSSGSIQQVESYRRKFLKEARNLSMLVHPNIVKVLDVFEENGTSYYVMEYITGGSLQQYIRQQGALSEEIALTYCFQLASALEYMHRNHVCHLDLKPGNILIDTEKLQVKLIDFGLSKQYDEEGEQTSSTPVGVSEGYAPMEQYETGGVSEFSPTTDIYSLGATLFFMLSGVKPPKASLVLNEGLPEFPVNVSAKTQNAVTSAMNPKRKDRPQTIENFLALLDDSIDDGETVVIDKEDGKTVILKKKPEKGEIIKKGSKIGLYILLYILTIMRMNHELYEVRSRDYDDWNMLFTCLVCAVIGTISIHNVYKISKLKPLVTNIINAIILVTTWLVYINFIEIDKYGDMEEYFPYWLTLAYVIISISFRMKDYVRNKILLISHISLIAYTFSMIFMA